MKKRTNYFLLAFIGVLMVFMTAYIQADSMDLGRHGIGEYVEVDLGQWDWWSTVGIPFLVGLTYLGTALFGLRANLANRGKLILFGGCFFIGCVLSILSGFGYIAAFATGICFATTFLGRKYA